MGIMLTLHYSFLVCARVYFLGCTVVVGVLSILSTFDF